MNNIKKVIDQKYSRFKSVTPADDILDSWGIHVKTWNKWVENEKDPSLEQLPLVADFLDCDVQELFYLETIKP